MDYPQNSHVFMAISWQKTSSSFGHCSDIAQTGQGSLASWPDASSHPQLTTEAVSMWIIQPNLAQN